MKSFALSTLLIGGASAHLNGLCSCTDSATPGQVDFIFPTYHEPPPAGGSVPGEAHITNPMGVSQQFTFSTFKAGERSKGNQGVTKRIELLKSSGIVTQTSTCSCYGATPAGSELTPAMDTSATTNTCAYGDYAWKTLYKATVTGAASGNYYIWTTNTNANLDPTAGMCSFNANAKLAIGLSVADGKAGCSTAAPSIAEATNGAGCAAGSISGSQCAQTCSSGMFPSGETSCYDGAWTSTFACSGAKACSASTAGATFNGAVGVIGSNCGFDTADGADCYLGCAQGSGHTGQKVQCNAGTWTVSDGATVHPTCKVGVPQATNDGPGEADLSAHAPASSTVCSHTVCEVKLGHTYVHDWHASEASGDHHHCVSDLTSGKCECYCGSASVMGSTSKIVHDATGDKKTMVIRTEPNHEPTDNKPSFTTTAAPTAAPCDCRDCNGNLNNGHNVCGPPVLQCDGIGNGPFIGGCYSDGPGGCNCGTRTTA